MVALSTTAPRTVVKVLVGLAVGTLALNGGVAGCDETPAATVVHVVDGDTIDVEHEGEEHRVRLLNIDTPETTDPDVECLGPEATAFLQGLLPVGSEVTLEFDEELEDQYGRVLAGVFHDGSLVNAEIAREGLGVAVLFEPNDRFYDDVSAAQDEARAAGRGMYDPSVDCTIPAQVEQFGHAVEGVQGSAPGSAASLESLESYAEELAAAAVLGAGLGEVLHGDASRWPLVAFHAPDLRRMRASVDQARATVDHTVEDNAAAIQAEKDRLAAERKAAEERRAAEEAARKAAEEEAARKAAEEEAARQAEQAARERAEAQEQAEAERRAQEEARRAQQRQPAQGSSGSSGGYDGYTGCRAYGGGYAPNAVDERGRPYTKINCATKVPIG